MNCPKCDANNWVMGPEGGGSQNILCRNCHTEYCESAFGLDAMKYDSDRIRHLYGIRVDEPQQSTPVEHKYSILDDMLSDEDII
jgi:hypothetical protein